MDGAIPAGAPKADSPESTGESRPSTKYLSKLIRNILVNEYGAPDTSKGIRAMVQTEIRQVMKEELRDLLSRKGTVRSMIREEVVKAIYPDQRYTSAQTLMREALQKALVEMAKEEFRTRFVIEIEKRG